MGYAYAQPWKGRSAYRYSVEVSVYLDHQITQQGIGSRLYGELFQILAERGFHAVIGGVTLPNPVSVRLHEKFGFEKVAHFKEVGYKFGKWIDVGYWEKIVNQ
jgi:L-amino acid N-acyltransferase YncA